MHSCSNSSHSTQNYHTIMCNGITWLYGAIYGSNNIIDHPFLLEVIDLNVSGAVSSNRHRAITRAD